MRRGVVLCVLGCVWLHAVPARADDDTFGGSTTSPPPAAPKTTHKKTPKAHKATVPIADDSACMVKDAQGVMRTCEELVREKDEQKAAAATPIDTKPVAAPTVTTTMVPDAPPAKLTAYEEELARVHLDPAQYPLLQMRVEYARAQQELADMEERGMGLTERDVIEAKVALVKVVLDDVERIAMHRLNVCATRAGKKTTIRNYRMTAGGPMPMTTDEIMRQATVPDPDGCERIALIDVDTVTRVKHFRALEHEVNTRNFTFYEQDAKHKLEDELEEVRAELSKDASMAVMLPGARD